MVSSQYESLGYKLLVSFSYTMYQIKLYSSHGPSACPLCLAEKNLKEASFLSKQHYLEIDM